MQELESSGLLDADSDMMDTEQPATATPAAKAGRGGAHGTAAPAALPAGSEAAAPADGAVSSDVLGSSPGGLQSVAAEAAAAAATAEEQQGPAEQRTLGMLAAAPDWYKVLDTGSGREYFWNVANNEVLWEPPEGIDGDTLLPVPADSAAAHSSGAEAEGAAAVDVAAETAAVTGAAAGTDAAPSATEAEPDAGAADDSAAGVVQETSGEQQPVQAPADAILQPAAAERHAASSPEQPTGGDPDAPATATPAFTAAAGSLQQPQAAATAVPTPQQDVQPVFSTLLAELQAAPEVQQQLQALPAAVKLLLQLQVLQQQWAVFAVQQQGAAAGEGGGRGFGWADYEHYIMQQLQQAAQQLQPTLQALQQGALPHPQHDQLQERPADQDQPAAATAAADRGTVPVAEGQHEAAAAAAAGDVVQPQEQQQEGAAGEEEAEEGEVAPSSPSSASEGEDMEVDLDASPVKSAAVPAAAKQPKQQRQPEQRVSAAAEHRGHYQGPPVGGVYASTMHMPVWARPSYNYSFAGHDPSPAADYHAAYGSYAAGYDYGMQGYPAHYDHSGYGRGYGSAAAAGAAVEAAPAAAAPPLPADEPPPLPDEAPPPLPTADAIHSSSSSSAAATASDAAPDAAAAAAGVVSEALPSGPHPAKRQKIVAAPAVRRPAAAAAAAAALPSGAQDGPAVFEDEAELAAAAAAAGISGKDGRKRARDQRAAATTAAPGTAGSKVKGGKVNALLNKWASVRQQEQEEEEQRQRQLEREADPEYLEAKRQRDLEQWSQQQMAAGAEDNPNFTPVMGDWRARLGLDSAGGAAAGPAGRAAETPEERAARKAAKKAAKAAKKASAVPAAATASAGGSGDGSSSGSAWPSSMKTKPDLAALSVGLPPGWVAMYEHDAKAGLYNIYYGNPVTKASLTHAGKEGRGLGVVDALALVLVCSWVCGWRGKRGCRKRLAHSSGLVECARPCDM